MLYLCITFSLIIILLIIISIADSKEVIKGLDRKEHKLYFLYPAAQKLLTITRLDHRLLKDSRKEDAFRLLEIHERVSVSVTRYWYKKIATVLFVLLLACVITLMNQLSLLHSRGMLEDNALIRPKIGEGKKTIDVEVTLEDSSKRNSDIFEKFQITVLEQEYTSQELEEAFRKGIQTIEKTVLYKNEDKSNVRGDLHFVSRLPSIGLKVEWRSGNSNVIGRDGTVYNNDLPPEGISVIVQVILSYKEKVKEHDMVFQVLPKPLSKPEELRRDIEKSLVESSKEDTSKERWRLPEATSGYTLTWKEVKENSGASLFILGLVTAVIIWFYGEKELQDQMEKRKKQLLLDYPEIINKFTLLINAGMTIRQAWTKISEDYTKKLNKRVIKKRYAYEEMLLTVRELRNGVSESEAYEQFGRRAGILPYMRFTTLITQNLRKGSKGLSDILQKEAVDAFAERKEQAKRLGEEAGTKLLAPMMIMLAIVLIIIIVPAFMSFGI